MSVVLLLLWSYFMLATAGSSPHADLVRNLFVNSDTSARISDNLLEDAILDIPDLIRKYNYPSEEHFVTTKDGYILGLQRIPHGRDAHRQPGSRPVVFLMHGLMSSSADFVVMGPSSALAYILAEEGYDVWMGNARGNYYSRRHLTLNPDAKRDVTFWKFSLDEIRNIDLPAMIDYVLANTGQTKFHYVGFSMGTTVFFVMGSLRPEYGEKVISMHAMAPAAYVTYSKNKIFKFLRPVSRTFERITSLFGKGELLANSPFMSWAGQNICSDGKLTQAFCSNFIFLVVGKNEDQHNATMLPVKLGHTPAGSSVRQLVHYVQIHSSKRFRRYNHGRPDNSRIYGSYVPPKYDLSKIKTPVFLHYSLNDPLTQPKDVDRLFKELGNPIGKFLVQDEKFSHLDYVWGIDAKRLVYKRIINLMKAIEVYE